MLTLKCNLCGAPVENGICTYCGKEFNVSTGTQNTYQNQTEPKIVSPVNSMVNNSYVTNQTVVLGRNAKNKWVSFVLCLILGVFGAHKFYEGKILMGVLYLFTLGICGIGVIVDLILILFKPNPYYV